VVQVSCDDRRRWLLWSSEFDALEEVLEVQAAAELRLALVNGATRVGHAEYRSVRLGRGFIHDGDAFVVPLTATAEARSFAAAALTGGTPVPPEERAWLALAEQSPNVRGVLRLIGAEPARDFSVPYKVLELVAEDVGEEDIAGIAEHSLATKDELRTFLTSAEDGHVSGDLARHAPRHRRKRRPVARLSLAEANEFALRIARTWLSSKVVR
jgi:hypothetical protein